MDEFLVTACEMLPPRRQDGRRSFIILARTRADCETRTLTHGVPQSKIYAAAILFPVAITGRIQRIAFGRRTFARRACGWRNRCVGRIGLRVRVLVACFCHRCAAGRSEQHALSHPPALHARTALLPYASHTCLPCHAERRSARSELPADRRPGCPAVRPGAVFRRRGVSGGRTVAVECM